MPGRNIYSSLGKDILALALGHSPNPKTPHIALITGAVFTPLLLPSIFYPESPVGAVLLNMAVFGAVISYIMQCLAFIILRKQRPDLDRPYRSPIGNVGAVIALIYRR